ncbi:MAG: ribonuclease HII [Chromatiaceae bacterium]|nr:ribonuclease HII [Ectothiorhodospira sp. BSL-9]TVQ74477.1 MAG: ribonuclease HII [Chromatiaceae bacterium]
MDPEGLVVTEAELTQLLAQNNVAGVDEVGRGPLAGPVVAAAVILDPARPIAGLMDSKSLTPARREALAVLIRERSLAWSLALCTPEEIDEMNILHATLEAMRRAVATLTRLPSIALVDGNRCPELNCAAYPVVKGDGRVPCISAASIIAKVHRDALMADLDQIYPGYGLATHKGYPTPAHRDALVRLGPSPCHRRSFAPVREAGMR